MERPAQLPDSHEPISTAGFSLIEILIAITLLTFAFLGMATLVMSNERSQVYAAEEAVIRNALRNQAERIRGTPFEDILSSYQGFTFAVNGVSGAGIVTIFTDETEDSDDTAALGFPRDLNGDGSASDTDVTTDYMLLAVRLRVTWQGASGTTVSDFHFLLSSEN